MIPLFPKILPIAIYLAGPLTLATPASASEWGCEVLLCASSSAPAWRGVPACHPPMTKLISAMTKPGFKWPTCPDGGSSTPGYEPHEDCPEGTTIGYSSNNDHGPSEPDQCIKTVNVCANGSSLWRYHDDGGGSCFQTTTTPRPRRQQPYYFDIRNDTTQKTERHWFELNK